MRSTWIAHQASATASTVPMAESTTLSTINWRINRQRPAPRAARIRSGQGDAALARFLTLFALAAGTTVALRGTGWDLTLAPGTRPAAAEIWDRVCRAATRSLTAGAEEHGLEWFRRHGAFVVPFPTRAYYLHATMVARGLRYELPYQERIQRIGAELAARLHERGIRWWDAQLEQYQALPR